MLIRQLLFFFPILLNFRFIELCQFPQYFLTDISYVWLQYNVDNKYKVIQGEKKTTTTRPFFPFDQEDRQENVSFKIIQKYVRSLYLLLNRAQVILNKVVLGHPLNYKKYTDLKLLQSTISH